MRDLMKKRAIIILEVITVILFVFINSCKKENNNNAPPVDFYVDLTSTQYFDLTIPGGGFMYVDGGIQGILILREGSNFYAYDRECTLKSKACQPIVMYKPKNWVATTN